ncbi:exonuclease 3'-5' domain-containing protein 1 [Mytilus galloprovincialis]|uniref:Exonuclease 3'-5' domain-containing protein 1 n=1 Tax=Mytilus galloprovincialis TaxID=29158 RepID=A0A8B6CPX3_MYTGA|nr:exonuclease 3'-5' domain-containing protein 1 [Mytilus galloprovincialis]
MANFIGRRVRIITDSRTYEGYVHLLDQQNHQISLQKVVIPDTGKKLNGLQTFFQDDITNIEVLEEECKKVENNDRMLPDKREHGTRLLHTKYTPSHLKGLVDFEPSNYLLRKVVNEEHSTGDVPKPANKSSDYDSSSDQETLDFEDCIYLSKINQRFHDAISHIKEQSEVGVSFSGVCIGRDGKLSLVQVATTIDVFVFDVLSLGPNCWDLGLKSIFEDPRLSKVMHDCRFPSDMLHHQFDVKLVNIFDTQVAEVFVYKLYHNGSWPKWVTGLSCSLFDHLGLPEDMVNNLKIRENLKKEDQEVWMQRPLPKNLLKIAIKEVHHLIQLRHTLMEKMMGEFIAGVDVYLAQVREASKEDVKKCQNNAHKLPVAFENLSGLLASRDSRRYNRHRYNRGPPDDHDFNKDSSGFNENCRGIIGLDVKYSNASIWHEGLGGSNKDRQKSDKPVTRTTESMSICKNQTNKISSSNMSEPAISAGRMSEPAISSSRTSEPAISSGYVSESAISSTPTGRQTLLKTPSYLLEKLKMAAMADEQKVPCGHTDENDNTTANQKPYNSPKAAEDNSDKDISVGRSIRSCIKYYDSDSDVILVPAGKMLQYGKLNKPKQKKLTEIEQMSTKVEELSNYMNEVTTLDNLSPNKSGASFSMGDSLTGAVSPRSFNASFGENFATAPTTPYQSDISESPSILQNTSLVENYQTAPTTPAINLSQILQSASPRKSSMNMPMLKSPEIMLSKDTQLPGNSYFNKNSMSVCSPSSPSYKSSQKTLTSSSESDCPSLYSHQKTSSPSTLLLKGNYSPNKGNNYSGVSKDDSSDSLNTSELSDDTSSRLKSTTSNIERIRILMDAAKKKSPKS